MIYFIDFDDTIFNTKDFIRDFKKIFHKTGVNEEVFKKSYIPYPNGFCGKKLKKYDLEKQLLDIEKSFGKKIKLREELNKFIKSSKEYIFKDFYEFVKKISKKEIFIVSFGDTDFQRSKIENSGVLDFVESYVLTNDSKADCIEKVLKKQGESDFVFVDDRPEQLEDVSKRFSSNNKIYKIIRSEGRFVDLPIAISLPEVKNLIEII